MPYVLLASATVFLSFSGIGATFYNRKNSSCKDTAPIYNLITLAVVFICWLIKFLTNPVYDLGVIPYSLLFTLGYTSAMIASVSVYREGPMMLSSLIMQLSMISTSIWGFFFWNSPVTLPVISGLVLVVVALVLCLYNGKSADSEKKINAKWLLLIAIYFVGNSVGSITQRTQQMNYESAYGDFLMVIATAISLLVCILRYLKSDRGDTKKILRSSGYIPAICGALNFIINLVVIILATQLSASVVYPVMMIGSLAITGIFSIFIFKEKMHWWQWIGVAVGALAIALLSI